LKQLTRVRAQAKQAWNQHRGKTKFEINEVVALWQPLHGSPDDWDRVWSQRLGDSGSSASAGSRR
jgi:hypothetical protein